MTIVTREHFEERDRLDSLAHLRSCFTLDATEIYLDGNSLGPVSSKVMSRIRDVVEREWASGLVRSWGAAGWMDRPTTVGDRLAGLIGAERGEVVVADSLTILLAKLIGGALDLRPNRHVVLTDEANFHSDIYIARAMAQRAGRPVEVRTINRNELDDYLNEDVALVMLTHVDFRTGEALDLADITASVHRAGALMLWDFAHTTGAVPVDVTSANVDFAAGCGYKYLNGGPGSPAYAYVRRSWQGILENPLPGWLGHARPFDFELEYDSAPGVQSLVTSSPSIVALAALEGALDLFDETSMSEIRAKSLALTDLFIELVESRLPGEFEIVTPRDHARRGSQVALRHPEGYGIVQALIARGVIGDFRDPDICRFGFAPLYVRFVDVYDAVERLVLVMERCEFTNPKFAVRKSVT